MLGHTFSAALPAARGCALRGAPKKGPGVFIFPDIAKFHLVHKPATKSRKGTNPFTGEPMTFAAKPARNIVKIRALKKLKEAAK